MKNYLKRYKIRLNTIGPVFIGDGRVIKKKEYILDMDKGRVIFPDFDKLISFLDRKDMLDSYEEFLLYGKKDLREFLRENGITEYVGAPWVQYDIPFHGISEKELKKGVIRQGIYSCVKDVYNRPYIPGSSLKGALRTAMLADKIITHKEKYQPAGERVLYSRLNRKMSLYKEAGELETATFNTINRVNERDIPIKTENVTNDIMSAVRIGDSKPLSTEDLMLARKIDVKTDGKSNELNIMRQAIRPGTDIEFEMTIDTSLVNITGEDIIRAVNSFSKYNSENLESVFCDMPAAGENTVYIGGGTGFWHKTVIYPLLGKEPKTVARVAAVINEGIGRNAAKTHRHSDDVKLGVSPHTIKRTDYYGKRYSMGLCNISIEPVI